MNKKLLLLLTTLALPFSTTNIYAEGIKEQNPPVEENIELEDSSQNEPVVEEIISEQPTVENVEPIQETTTEIVETPVEETISVEPIVEPQLNVSMMKTNNALPLTSSPTEEKEESEDLTVNVTNILRINNNAKDADGNPIQTSIDGHAIAWDNTYTLVDGQSKLASGFNSMVGGKNASAGGVGYNYTFQNEFVLTEEGENPVYIDENENPYIQKVQYKNGNTIVYFKDGTSQTYDNTNSIYISPVYKAKENWYLEYNYVDEISTGSGSWKNLDAVSEYQHTFSDPSEKTPVEDYQFVEWRNDETGETFQAGDTDIYTSKNPLTGKTIKDGEHVEVEIDAYWQPVNSVEYTVNGTIDSVAKTFEDDITIYDHSVESPDENVTFEGWYKDANFETRVEEDFVKELPEATKTKVDTNPLKVFAQFVTDHIVSKIWNDSNNQDSLRPSSIIAWLFKNGERTNTSAELNAENNWTYTFTNLTAYDADGNLIEYSADEIEVPNEYEKTVGVEKNKTTITNSHTPRPSPLPTPTPDPDPDPTPGPTPSVEPGPIPEPTPTPEVIPVVVNPAPQAAQIVTPVIAEVTEEEPSVEAEPAIVELEEPEVPLAAPEGNWALINLITTILSVIIAFGMLLTGLFKKSYEKDNDEEENEDEGKHKASKIFGILPAALSILLFLMTEDIRLPMVLVDKWTLPMIIILIISVILAYLTKNKKKEKDEEEEEF